MGRVGYKVRELGTFPRDRWSRTTSKLQLMQFSTGNSVETWRPSGLQFTTHHRNRKNTTWTQTDEYGIRKTRYRRVELVNTAKCAKVDLFHLTLHFERNKRVILIRRKKQIDRSFFFFFFFLNKGLTQHRRDARCL